MKRTRTRKVLLMAILFCSLILAAVPGTTSAGYRSTDIYLNLKRTNGGGSGIWGPIRELSASEAHARAVLTHARNQKRLQQASSANNAAQSMDIDVNGDGVRDVAVIVDNGKIL